MGWEKQENFTIKAPQFVYDMKTSIEDFYDTTIKPYVGENYPPELGGSIGNIINIINTVAENLTTQITDPFASFIKAFGSQLTSTVSNIANTGVSAIVVHPYNVDGADMISVPVDPIHLPPNFQSLYYSAMAIRQEMLGVSESLSEIPVAEYTEAIKTAWVGVTDKDLSALNIENLFSMKLKKLTPMEAVNKVINSLYDDSDAERPQIGPGGAVAGFGILITSGNYIEFMSAVNMIKEFFNFKDIVDFADSIDKKIDSKIALLGEWDEIYEEWKNENIENNPIVVASTALLLEPQTVKLSMSELREQYLMYKEDVPLIEVDGVEVRSMAFRYYLQTVFATNATRNPIKAQKPNWYSLTLSNSVTCIKDIYESIAFYSEQINGYVKEASSTLKEAIFIFQARVQQLIDVVARILSTIETFASLPELLSVHTISFAEDGGTDVIAEQLALFDDTGMEDNNFTLFALFTAQSVAINDFKMFFEMFNTLADQWSQVNLLDNGELVNDLDQLSTEENPGSTSTLDETVPLNDGTASTPTEPPALSSDIQSMLAVYANGSALNPPIAFSSGRIDNNVTYPPIAPYWDNVSGVTITAYLQECDGDFTIPIESFRPFTKGTSIDGNVNNTPTYYNLKVDALRDNNSLVTSITYSFIIDYTLKVPPRIFPSNITEAGVYTEDPDGVRWEEYSGYSISAHVDKNFGSEVSPDWKNWDYVDPGHPGTGSYLKGYELPNGSYRITLRATSIAVPALYTNNITSFIIDSTAYKPNDNIVTGITNRQVYSVPTSFSWSPDSALITTTATIKRNGGIAIPITSADIPYSVTDDGTYKLRVTTINSQNTTYTSVKTYTFVIDKVYPSYVPVLYCSEIQDNQVYPSAFKLYWSKNEKAVSVADLINYSNTMVYNDRYSQLSYANIVYSELLYWEFSRKENTLTLSLYEREEGDTASLVAIGTREGNGVVSLVAQNNSGVTGEITLEYKRKISLNSSNIIAPNGISAPVPMGTTISTNGSYELNFTLSSLTGDTESRRKLEFTVNIPDLRVQYLRILPYSPSIQANVRIVNLNSQLGSITPYSVIVSTP